MRSNLTVSKRFRSGSTRPVLSAALLLVFTTGAAAQSESAGPHCVPVGGTVATNFLDSTTTLGVATGDLRGAVSATLLGTSSGPNNTVVFDVQHHWVTETGDTIQLSVAQAVATPVAPGLLAVVDYPVTIAGGTGRFKGASGTVRNIGEVDLGALRTVFRYHGEVCFAAASKQP